MELLTILLVVSLLLLGIRTTYTDIRWHKAYNRDLAAFAIIGSLIQIVYFYMSEANAIDYIINFGFSVALSYMFYIFHIWAAGDAKLFFTSVLLIPCDFYTISSYEIFPAFYVLGFIFSTALFYISIESVLLFLRDIIKNGVKTIQIGFFHINANTLISWLMGYFVISLFNSILIKLGGMYIYSNRALLILVNIMLVTVVLTFAKTKKSKSIVLICAILLKATFMIVFKDTHELINVQTMLIAASMILIRKFTNQYSYQLLPICKVRKGMILAHASLLNMLPSQVNGIPTYTDETTRSRLTAKEVDAIKRWETSKYGQDHIIVVRHIPFAPFIFVGTMLFITFKLYI